MATRKNLLWCRHDGYLRLLFKGVAISRSVFKPVGSQEDELLSKADDSSASSVIHVSELSLFQYISCYIWTLTRESSSSAVRMYHYWERSNLRTCIDVYLWLKIYKQIYIVEHLWTLSSLELHPFVLHGNEKWNKNSVFKELHLLCAWIVWSLESYSDQKNKSSDRWLTWILIAYFQIPPGKSYIGLQSLNCSICQG